MSIAAYDPFASFPSRWQRGWGVLKTLVFLLVLGGAGWLLIRQTVDQQLTHRVEDQFNASLREAGLQARVGEARFVEQSGLRLSDVSLRLASQTGSSGLSSSIEIYEMFVGLPVSLTDLAWGQLEPSGLEIRRAVLTVVRDDEGNWDFADAIEPLLQLRRPDAPPIPVQFRDCELRMVESSRPGSPRIVSGLNCTLTPRRHEGRLLWQLEGSCGTRAVSQIQWTTFVDLQAQRWQTRIFAQQAELSTDLLALLPASLTPHLQDLKTLRGRLDLEAEVEGAWPVQAEPRFSLAGQVQDLTVDDSRLPVPVRHLSAGFHVDNQGLAITEASGQLGEQGSFFLNYSQTGLMERGAWHADGWVKQLEFDYRGPMRQWLPDYCQQFCDDYAPIGTSDVQFEMTDDGRQLHRRLLGTLTDMSFCFDKLPYRVDHCRGTIDWLNDQCTFDLHSQIGDQTVKLNGVANNIGHGATYRVNVAVPGRLPIDQKMLTALDAQEQLAQIVRQFNPTGYVGGVGTIEKRDSEGEVARSYDVRLEGCRVRHNGFDYPIENINGLVQVREGRYTFQQLQGSNSSGRVRCNGTWDPDNGLLLRFLCQSIPLNDQLRYALSPETREIWNGFRPRGKLDHLRVDLALPIGGELDVVVEAIMKEASEDPEANYVSIYPVWFPYQINHLTGRVKIGKGEITLTEMGGRHQKTTIFCRGQGHYSDSSWSLRLQDLLVSALQVDDDLLAAVPESLAPRLSQLEYEGLVNVNGEITLAGTKQVVQQPNPASAAPFRQGPADSTPLVLKPARTSMAWDVDIHMSQARMLLGLPVENLFGAVSLAGIYDGNQVVCDGRLDLDSFTIYDAQVTQVQGPIRIENERVLAGAFADEVINLDWGGGESALGESRQPQSITGILHGGVARLDAQLSSNAANEFFVQASLADSCLGTACREFSPDLRDIEGRSFATLRLRGDGSGTHSHRGEGSIQLRDAKIYELPVFLSLLKILNVRQLTRTAFDSSNIEFRVFGETIEFERMEFIGDAISLIGQGRMNLERDIDLDFYTVMGRNRLNIPLISELYRAGSQKIVQISVDGKLDDPHTHRTVLPQLNDSLKQLFQGPAHLSQPTYDPMVRPVSSNQVGQNFFHSSPSGPFQYSAPQRR